jgi:hypothetical protein
MRPEPARKAFARAGRLAKRPGDVQQADSVFPPHRGRMARRKSRRNPAAFALAFDPPKSLSEPLRAAIPAAVTIPAAIAVVAAVAVPITAIAMPPALAAPAVLVMR